ncbi:hypothetical protein GCM10010140_44600 [Streptosporangium pseudovulgare]|uniref:Uncharacterized protein n=1 Tax=Streptosporangium pseudovulgare TaxID=35765 RepID=A0ABQ2R2K1_9ACTN|nr:hypothetical protein GCM10010140_44600 [Streptosporangium pseudovulgare]
MTYHVIRKITTIAGIDPFVPRRASPVKVAQGQVEAGGKRNRRPGKIFPSRRLPTTRQPGIHVRRPGRWVTGPSPGGGQRQVSLRVAVPPAGVVKERSGSLSQVTDPSGFFLMYL